MSKVVRLSARPGFGIDPLIDFVARDRPQYAAFMMARRTMLNEWRKLIDSGELDLGALRDEAEGNSVMLQIVDLMAPPTLATTAQPSQKA